MPQIEELIEYFLSFPKDLTYRELKRILEHLGYAESAGGKGSHFRFSKPNKDVIIIAKPHGGKSEIQRIYLKQIAAKLKENGDL